MEAERIALAAKLSYRLNRAVKISELGELRRQSWMGLSSEPVHLEGLGHRRAAILSENLKVSSSRERIRGFKQGLSDMMNKESVKQRIVLRPELIIRHSTSRMQ